ncbi:MAG: hypothetical protein HETSPECPRED_009303 [Heterodermia speciosa]|uniref:Uncharacterized protein n=1 Tax=Heterodermia speciosa TaxID=116794 RepID=A0A8H3G4H1_9LECA|nr:MAG: hypothetical protein HETSPECPRED_009303 [Heterodermia speciosa]
MLPRRISSVKKSTLRVSNFVSDHQPITRSVTKVTHSNSLYELVSPAGLRVSIIWSSLAEGTFLSQEIYFSLVTFQSFLAGFAADSLLAHDYFFTMPLSNAQMRNDIAYYGMTFREAVWGIYETGLRLASRYPSPQLVPRFSANIFTYSGLRGILRVEDPTARTNLTELVLSRADMSVISRRRRDLIIPLIHPSVKEADSGEFASLDDPDLVIYYHFQHRALTSGQMLTSFLKAMLFCAEHDGEERGVSITAFSADRFTRVRMESVIAPGPECLDWRRARYAMRVLWKNVVMNYDERLKRFTGMPRFESFSFLVQYQGVRIGEGWVG